MTENMNETQNEPEKVAAEEKQEAPKREPKPVTITDIELEQLQAERREFKEKYLLSLAESENFRKRMFKERDELIQYAIANVLSDFLQPLDSFEKALGFADGMSDEVKNWAYGFRMIMGQMHQAMSNHGVVGFDSVGMEFDPAFHEAVEVEETTNHAPGKILLEYSKGYKLGKRTLRPARVKVAKEPNIETSQEEKENN
jgi:molecular chaperone GrpE